MDRIFLICVVVLFSAVASVSAAEYTVAKNDWLHIPIEVPENKAGGGDFYNLQLVPPPSGNTTEYEILEKGVNIRFETMGLYDFRVVVNHVNKSSCAGVTVKEYLNEEIRVHVVD